MADMKLMKELMETIRQKENGPQPYDTTAEVVRVDGGTAWVSIPGGEGETPVQMSINARPGDTVRVRVAGGQAWTVGNDTAPPTDDTVANEALLKVNEIEASKIIANLIEAGAINADWINSGSISANRISGGVLVLGGDELNVNGLVTVLDDNGTAIERIGFWGIESYKRSDGWYEPLSASIYLNGQLGIVSNSDRYISGRETTQRISSRLYDGNISIYGNGGTTPSPDSPLIPEAYYQETPLFHINVEHIDPQMQGENVTNISSLSNIDFYIGGTDPNSIYPYQWDSHFGSKVLTIDADGISMESGKTVDGVDVSEIPCHISTSGSADMNDYRTEGTYYFSSGVTLSNVPNGAVNGWLQVLPANGSRCKQFWYRFGSNGGTPPTYTDFYERLYTGAEWLAWERIVTEELLTNRLGSYVPTSRTVNGHALSSNVTVTSSDVGLPLGSNVDGVGHYITSSGYPYIRYRDTDDKGYQLVVNASGIRYQTQASSSASWVTVWGLEANDANGKTASTVSAANATDTTLCNSGSLAAGTYVLIGTASFASSATGRRALFLSTSSTGGVINRWARTTVPPTSGGVTQVQVVMLANFTSATTVYLRAYQNSGGALNITDAGIQFIKLH